MLPSFGAIPAARIISLYLVTFQFQDRLCKACKLMDNWRPHVMATHCPYSASYPRVCTLYTALTTNSSASPETQRPKPIPKTEFLPL